MGSEVLLESRSPDMDDIAYTSEWLKQNTNIHGWLSFFIFSLTLGGLVSAIFPIVTYNSEDYGGNVWLGASDVVSGFIMLGIAMYAIYLFVSRKPNAVFWGISYVIIIFLLNAISLIDTEEATGFLGTRSIVQRLIWGVIWLLYLIFSEQVKEVIPKKFRKVSKWDVGILAVTIIIPIMLFVIGISQIAFLSIKQEKQENELLHRELSDNERTDGRVVFTIPDGFVCDSQEVNVNGSPITLFIIQNDDGISCTICSDYDNDSSNSNFDSYWENWKEEDVDEYPMKNISSGRSIINGNTCLCRITRFDVNGVFVYWRYYILFNQETGKAVVASFYDRNQYTDYVDELLYSIRFQ